MKKSDIAIGDLVYLIPGYFKRSGEMPWQDYVIGRVLDTCSSWNTWIKIQPVIRLKTSGMSEIQRYEVREVNYNGVRLFAHADPIKVIKEHMHRYSYKSTDYTWDSYLVSQLVSPVRDNVNQIITFLTKGPAISSVDESEISALFTVTTEFQDIDVSKYKDSIMLLI